MEKRPANQRGVHATSARRPAKAAPATYYLGPFPLTKILQMLVIVGAASLIYWPALHGGFMWDDANYLTENALLRDPHRLWQAWFQPGSFVEYYPIQQSLQWLQWKMWGVRTFGYHLTNLILHIVSSFLIWRLLAKFKLRFAWLGGLLFAIHPAQVESVAWISEFKNTLSLPPFLMAMCAWIDYQEDGRARDYGAALSWFLIAMLCKTTMALFPMIILLFAWWNRNRIAWADIKASAPFFLVSLVLGTITILTGIWFRQLHYLSEEAVLIGGIPSRLALASLSFSFYFSTSLLPLDMMPMPPKWVIDPPSWPQFIPWIFIIGVALWLWTRRTEWARACLLGLGFFIINLLPFLGLIAGTYMKAAWVMDHFLYIPIIGLIGLVVAGLGRLETSLSPRGRIAGRCFIAFGLVLLACESRAYAGKFIDGETLWSYALERNPDAYFAYIGLGHSLQESGRFWAAGEQYEKAIQVDPREADAYDNLGGVLQQTGRGLEAIDRLEQAVQIRPDWAEARYNLGNALQARGRFAEAIDQYHRALALNPRMVQGYNNLGNALQQAGRLDDSIRQYQDAVQLAPDDAEACNNMGYAYQLEGRWPDAIRRYRQAIQIRPALGEAHSNLGVALNETGQTAEAVEQFQEALRINPSDEIARKGLGRAQPAGPVPMENK